MSNEWSMVPVELSPGMAEVLERLMAGDWEKLSLQDLQEFWQEILAAAPVEKPAYYTHYVDAFTMPMQSLEGVGYNEHITVSIQTEDGGKTVHSGVVLPGNDVCFLCGGSGYTPSSMEKTMSEPCPRCRLGEYSLRGKPAGQAFVKPTILKETNVGYAPSSGAIVPPAGGKAEFDEASEIEKAKLAWDGSGNWGDFLGDCLHRAHVTRLTAERDGLNAELILMRDAEKQATESLWQTQSELTKALELLRRMTTDYACCLEAGHERITALGGDCDSVEKMLNDNRDYAESRAFLAHQSAPAAKCSICNGTGVVGDASIGYDHCFHSAAPAAKGGESGETICLLCFDKKTVPGPKHGDFVRDCPECCGEEG